MGEGIMCLVKSLAATGIKTIKTHNFIPKDLKHNPFDFISCKIFFKETDITFLEPRTQRREDSGRSLKFTALTRE
uniref:Uncharacterized protein n=1 Tax=Cannabis sativa TaxID=3483 RepID=A0A803Q7U3_CANSA